MSLTKTIRRIVLIGFMGAGKSTVGAMLAQKLGWDFIDTDAVIETRSGIAISQIFAQKGEQAFRSLEVETIREFMGCQNLVLALGGGAIEAESTRETLGAFAGTYVVFLEAPLDTLIARCLAQPGAAERPVLADRERLLQRFIERLPHYRSAHLTVLTEGLTPERVATQVVETVERRRMREAAAEGETTR